MIKVDCEITEKSKKDAIVFAAKMRREQIAIAAMSGLLASPHVGAAFSHVDVADDAVAMADALMRRLDGDKP